MAISALNRKLVRDLIAMRGQALAIALVVASGITLYVTYLSNFESLRRSQQAYYEQQHFGDIFATLKRAPLALAADIRRLPGVSAIETRVVADVPLDVDGMELPATARLISIPADRRPLVNDLVLRRGRWIDPDRSDEVLASEGFVRAQRLEPGDSIRAVINGRRRELTIVGVALSPEYIYSINPGEMVPDEKRFGVLWMNSRAVAAAFDMEGAFNDVSLLLGPGVRPDEVVARLEVLLEPYGGRGVVPRALQYSHWTLENELTQLESFGLLLPMIFLLVGAFVLNVALSRAMSLQRSQIASLKALGYSTGALAWHYLKWAFLIGLAGLVLGDAAGAWLGRIVAEVYNRYFHFPNLIFRVPISTLMGAGAFTMGAAAAGAGTAVWRAVRVPPAEAMRPEPPARFSRTWFDSKSEGLIARMVLRNVWRRPLRAASSVFGIACAVALLMVGLVMFDAMDRLIETEFWVAERQDAAITFIEPRSADARYHLAALPGVITVEGERSVSARVRMAHRQRYLSIVGIPADARFQRIVDADGRVIEPPASGVAMSRALAQALGVSVGEVVTIDVLEGARPRVEAPVTQIVDDVLGLSIYMELQQLHRMMHEGDTLSSALILFDPAMRTPLLRALKNAPAVAGVSLKREIVRTFRETMAGTMNVTIAVNVLFASIVAIGVVYNAARVALSERSRDLASLRVLGYTRAEISLMLLSEIALLTAAALPIGVVLGYGLSAAVFNSVQSEVYRFPQYVSASSAALACVFVLVAAAAASLIVRQRLDRLDLIAVLKVQE